VGLCGRGSLEEGLRDASYGLILVGVVTLISFVVVVRLSLFERVTDMSSSISICVGSASSGSINYDPSSQ
jgi:hypothetical protein